MERNENRQPVAADKEHSGNDPRDLPVIDLEDYETVKPERFRRRGKKSIKED